MNRLAENEIYHGRAVPDEEVLAEIGRLTPDDLQRCARQYLLDRPVACAFIGPPEARTTALGRDRF